MKKQQSAEYTKCEYYGEDRDSGLFGWKLANRNMELFVTETGGHVAPVNFCLDTGLPVSPYYISPWQEESVNLDEPVLLPLRGNFFCMPFGGNAEPFKGEKHRVHGETAGGCWRFRGVSESDNRLEMTLQMDTAVRPGRVTKTIMLQEGHNVVYSRHLLENYSGPMPLGFHALLRVPDQPESLLFSAGKFDFGMTNPQYFSSPVNREYQSLSLAGEFRDLRQVPLLWKNPANGDFTTFPQHPGYDDMLIIMKKDRGVPAWSAAVYPKEGFLWFALKDASMLPATALWISNRGRHGAPWNGRNVCLGIEDCCGYFAAGIKESSEPNLLNRKGFPTAVELDAQKPIQINYIEGAVKVGGGFGRVDNVLFEQGMVVFVGESGERAAAPVDISFLNPEFS